MAKNLVVCCDGTSNQFSVARTNVAKLCLTLVQQPEVQEVYYHPGLGTMEPPGALTDIAAWVTRTLGLAIGYGLPADIRDAYVFVMNHFEPGDHLYIFGFSRGAYTARALASLLHMYGLLRSGNEALVPYAIRMMLAVNRLSDRKDEKSRAEFAEIKELAAEFKRSFSIICKPWFVGVWDTVNSVGLVSQSFHIPFTANNPDIETGRHALSIDERRGFFRQSEWYPHDPDPGPKDIKQVWFPGNHSDVGGGFPEKEAGLSKCALKWMICEAFKKGLLFDEDRLQEMFGRPPSHYVPEDPKGPLHDSMNWLWGITEFIPKKRFDPPSKSWRYQANLFRLRVLPEGAMIHDAAFLRGGDYIASRRNLPKHYVRVHTECDPSLGI